MSLTREEAIAILKDAPKALDLIRQAYEVLGMIPRETVRCMTRIGLEAVLMVPEENYTYAKAREDAKAYEPVAKVLEESEEGGADRWRAATEITATRDGGQP